MTDQQSWLRVKARLRAIVGDESWSLWLTTIRCDRIDADTVHLSVPNRTLIRWIERHYWSAIVDCWRAELGRIEQVAITIRAASWQPTKAVADETIVPAAKPMALPIASPRDAPLGIYVPIFGDLIVNYRLGQSPGDLEPQGITILKIQRAVCCRFATVSRIDLISQRRTQTVVRPRQIAMYLAKTRTIHSLPSIGRHFGNRDHTTVLHAVRKIAALAERDPALAALIETINDDLNAKEKNHEAIDASFDHQHDRYHPHIEISCRP